jgi:hypothetical protein
MCIYTLLYNSSFHQYPHCACSILCIAQGVTAASMYRGAIVVFQRVQACVSNAYTTSAASQQLRCTPLYLQSANAVQQLSSTLHASLCKRASTLTSLLYCVLILTTCRPSEVQFGISPKAIEGTLSAQFEVYPSAVSSLTKALARLIQEPYGCFEQTASTMYPMTMALQVSA